MQTFSPAPLPRFIQEFLEKENIKITSPSKPVEYAYYPPDSLEESIHSLSQVRTPRSINYQYLTFKNRVLISNFLIQSDLNQFIYPLFILLAHSLFSYGFNNEFNKFVKDYRYDHPGETQSSIDQLIDNPSAFKPPTFDISMTKYSYFELVSIIEMPEMALISFLIATKINITSDSNFIHPRLFLSPESATTFNSKPEDPIMLPTSFTMPKLSVKFTGNPDESPSVIYACDESSKSETGINLRHDVSSHHHSDTQPSISIQSKTLSSDNSEHHPNFEENHHPIKQSSDFEPKEIQYLTQSYPDVVNFTAYNHMGRINAMHISPNLRLLSLAQDSSLVIETLDTNICFSTHKIIDTIALHCGGVFCSSFSPNGRFIASGGADCQLKLSQLEVFLPISHRLGHEKPILDVSFNSNSSLIATASLDRSVMLWDLNTPHGIRLFAGHTQAATKTLFSPDKQDVISSSADGTVRIWDIGTAKCKACFRCDGAIPAAIAIDKRNEWIAAACDGGQLFVWDTAKGNLVAKRDFAMLGSNVTDCCFTNDGSFLLVSNLEGKLLGYQVHPDFGFSLKLHAEASTIDSITVSERNLVAVCGRSTRGGVDI